MSKLKHHQRMWSGWILHNEMRSHKQLMASFSAWSFAISTWYGQHSRPLRHKVFNVMVSNSVGHKISLSTCRNFFQYFIDPFFGGSTREISIPASSAMCWVLWVIVSNLLWDGDGIVGRDRRRSNQNYNSLCQAVLSPKVKSSLVSCPDCCFKASKSIVYK